MRGHLHQRSCAFAYASWFCVKGTENFSTTYPTQSLGGFLESSNATSSETNTTAATDVPTAETAKTTTNTSTLVPQGK